MSEAAYIITPAGSVVAASGGGNPVLSGNTVTWNGHVEVLPNMDAAQIYFDNLTNLLTQKSTAPAVGFTQNMFLPVLYSISPNSFELPTAVAATAFATTHITINGAGFVTGGKLFIDDFAGGIDQDGYYLTCVFVNENTLIADAGNSGNALLYDGACLITFKDTTSAITSNALNGIITSDPSYPVVTIPE